MGCDIHFHVEVKINKVWRHYSTAKIRRDYKVFTKLGNIRNENHESHIEPLSDNRGIPKDASFMTNFCYLEGALDAYGESYINAKEIGIFHDWLRAYDRHFAHKYIPYVFGNHLDGLLKYAEDWRRKGIEDARYIFWFDN